MRTIQVGVSEVITYSVASIPVELLGGQLIFGVEEEVYQIDIDSGRWQSMDNGCWFNVDTCEVAELIADMN